MPDFYERFTNRACVVMQLAFQEARRFNHDYVGTEHILLGLVKEGVRTRRRPGVAARVLKQLDILDLRKMRVEVEKVVHSGSNSVVKGELCLNTTAHRVIEFAIEEAGHLSLPDIGTGFLMLGLLHEQEDVAAQVLKNVGVKVEDIREKVLRFLGK